jgi:hypothetical protein
MALPADRIMLAREVLVDIKRAVEKLHEIDELMCQHVCAGLLADVAVFIHREVMLRAGKA